MCKKNARVNMCAVVAGVIVCLAAFTGKAESQSVGASQLIMVPKLAISDLQKVSVFIHKNDLTDGMKKEINSAAAQGGLKVTIYPIKSSADIGKNIKRLESNSILIVFPSDLFSNNSSMLYILSRCKKKNIGVVSATKQFSTKGALMGIYKDEGGFEVALNLKMNPSYQSDFTEAVIQKVGITKVIR